MTPSVLFSLSFPPEQIALLFCLGAVLGAAANYLVDQLGWERRRRSCWSRLPKAYRPFLRKKFCDFLPLLGWLTMRRFQSEIERLARPVEQGGENIPRQPGFETDAFWIRPFWVELGFGLFVVFYYYWEVLAGASSFSGLFTKLYPDSAILETTAILSTRFAVHLFLFFVLLIAALVDFDDYIIPDVLMIPATLVGIALMTALPNATLPSFEWIPALGLQSATAHATLLTALPQEFFERFSSPLELYIMLGCWLFWCFALLDRRWYSKLGLKNAAFLFLRRLKRSSLTPLMGLLAIAGSIAIVSLSRCGAFPAVGIGCGSTLLALCGMAVGMALIWTVRLIGRVTLGREAMGFGDVVLMGFIGVFVGWQGAILVFFLAPFAGLVFGLIRSCFRTEREIPYGPFLAAGTLFLLLFWPPLWFFVEPVMSDGPAVLTLLGIGVVLLAVLLGAIRLLKILLFCR